MRLPISFGGGPVDTSSLLKKLGLGTAATRDAGSAPGNVALIDPSTGTVSASIIPSGSGGGSGYVLPPAAPATLGGVRIGTPVSGQFVSGFASDGTALYAAPTGGGSGPANTDGLPEGTTNRYFRQDRARGAISVTGSLGYEPTTGVISYTAPALAAVATSGAYGDLTGRPALAAVATSGSADDLLTGTLPAARLPASGVTAGTYGSGAQIPVITTDGTGRITGITTAANSGGGGGGGNVSASGSFAVNDVVLAATTDGTSIKSGGQASTLVRGLLSGTAGVSYNTSTGAFSLAAPTTTVLGGVLSASAGTNQFQRGVDTTGAPLFAQPSFANLSGSATAAQLPAFTGGDVTAAAGSTALTLVTTGVTAGSYTNANITLDAKGRVTAASNGAAGGGGNVSTSGTPTNGQLATFSSANTIQGVGTLPAANFPALTGDLTTTAGSLATTLAASGVTAQGYSGLHSVTFDAKGRATAAANVALTGDVTTTAGSLATTLATVNGNIGSFTYASVTVNAKGLVTAVSSGAAPPNAASGAQVRALASTNTYIPPSALADAMAFVTDTYAATYAPNFGNGFHRTLVATGNTTFGQFTGGADGESVVIRFVQDGTGNRTIAFNTTYWKIPPALTITASTAANAIDKLYGQIVNRSGTLVVEVAGYDKAVP